jgi:hypothetical protein
MCSVRSANPACIPPPLIQAGVTFNAPPQPVFGHDIPASLDQLDQSTLDLHRPVGYRVWLASYTALLEVEQDG